MTIKRFEPVVYEDMFEVRDFADIGDEIRFKTYSTQRKRWMEVVDTDIEGYPIVETDRGTRYYVFISELHPLEPVQPSVRKVGGYDSLGEIEWVEVKKD